MLSCCGQGRLDWTHIQWLNTKNGVIMNHRKNLEQFVVPQRAGTIRS